jgi:hypothetical protein
MYECRNENTRHLALIAFTFAVALAAAACRLCRTTI